MGHPLRLKEFAGLQAPPQLERAKSGELIIGEAYLTKPEGSSVLSEVDRHEIVKLYQDGYKVRDIERILRLPMGSIVTILKERSDYDAARLTKSAAQKTKEALTDAALKRVKESGFSCAAVSRVLKVSPQVVRRHANWRNPKWLNADRFRREYSVAKYHSDPRFDHEIARDFGIHPMTIAKWKRQNKIPVKTRKNYPKDLPFDDRAESLYKRHSPAVFKYYGHCDESCISERLVRSCCIASYLDLLDLNADKYLKATIRLAAKGARSSKSGHQSIDSESQNYRY
jgi:transposase